MNTRILWKCLLIMLLLIIPISAIIGLFFSGFYFIYGIPLALLYIPLFCIVLALLSLFAVRDSRKRKDLTVGIVISAAMWGILFASVVILPSKVQKFFRGAIPGLAQSDLEREGKQIAAAVSGTFIQSFVSEGDSRVAVEGWHAFVNASVHNGSLSIQGSPLDSLAALDSLTIVTRLSKMIHPFLNPRGRQTMEAGNVKLISKLHPVWSEFRVFVMDSGNIAVESFITVHGLSFTISKGYCVLDE